MFLHIFKYTVIPNSWSKLSSLMFDDKLIILLNIEQNLCQVHLLDDL